MKNLIFVSKTTGLECLKFHLEKFANDENYIVAGNPDKEDIIRFLLERNIQYVDINDFALNSLHNESFDWLLNLWGGYIFKKDLLSKVKNSLNIHPSYLPYGRGRDPVVWTIRNQDPVGATLHEINEQVDGGAIWVQEKVDYALPIAGGDLYEKVVNACLRVFKEHWPKIRELRYTKIQQGNLDLPTRKREDLLKDQVIDFEGLTSDQKDLFLRILAHDFGEGYSSLLQINGDQYKIRFQLEKIVKEGI